MSQRASGTYSVGLISQAKWDKTQNFSLQVFWGKAVNRGLNFPSTWDPLNDADEVSEWVSQSVTQWLWFQLVGWVVVRRDKGQRSVDRSSRQAEDRKLLCHSGLKWLPCSFWMSEDAASQELMSVPLSQVPVLYQYQDDAHFSPLSGTREELQPMRTESFL